MSIVIIQKPGTPSHPLSAGVLGPLVQRAANAGLAVTVHACHSDRDVVEALAQAERAHAEVVLVDPGAGVECESVQAALRTLSVPYIEVHDDTSGSLEPELHGDAGKRIGVVHGYLAQGYTLAMAIALEHLGRSDCDSDVHVGT